MKRLKVVKILHVSFQEMLKLKECGKKKKGQHGKGVDGCAVPRQQRPD